jgi:hypothetical protein
MWVPVTTAWCAIRLRMEERAPMWGVEVCVGPCYHGMVRPQVADGGTRSEERRVGKEGGSSCRSRWSPDH